MKGASMLMHLVPLAGGPAIPIDKPILFFGRQPECDIVLLNSRKVSRKHCCIAQIDDHFVVRDLGSMNGVRVNDKNVSKECRVAAGDQVHIGDVGFRLEVRTPEKRSAPVAPTARKAPAAPAVKTAPKKAPAGKPNRRLDPMLLSQDLPVAIDDEAEDFIVEETQRKLKPAKRKPPIEGEIIELDDIDIIED
jgi:pSer/pThr/pTyr-binding forkhead associated (FHA) protein